MMIKERQYTPTDYRFGFNGKELDNETYNGSIAFEARIYDSRLGRFLSTDPWEYKYAWQTPYAYFKNTPTQIIDFLGKGGKNPPNRGHNSRHNHAKTLNTIHNTTALNIVHQTGIRESIVRHNNRPGQNPQWNGLRGEYIVSNAPHDGGQSTLPTNGARYAVELLFESKDAIETTFDTIFYLNEVYIQKVSDPSKPHKGTSNELVFVNPDDPKVKLIQAAEADYNYRLDKKIAEAVKPMPPYPIKPSEPTWNSSMTELEFNKAYRKYQEDLGNYREKLQEYTNTLNENGRISVQVELGFIATQGRSPMTTLKASASKELDRAIENGDAETIPYTKSIPTLSQDRSRER
jgi:RHS repeat-associated protein